MKVPVPWNAPSPIEEAIATTGLVGGAGGGGVLDLVIGSGPFLSIIYNFFCTFFLIRRRVRTGWIRMDPFDVDGIGDGSQGRRLLTFIDARRRLPSNRLVCVCVPSSSDASADGFISSARIPVLPAVLHPVSFDYRTKMGRFRPYLISRQRPWIELKTSFSSSSAV